MSSSKKTIDETSSLREIAHKVCDALLRQDVNAVLSGGAVVSIYTENKDQSYDLDFISQAPVAEIAGILSELGFTQRGTRYFSHPNSKFEIEFPGSIMMVGDTAISDYAEDANKHGTLR